MAANSIIYRSDSVKTVELASEYLRTHKVPYRYLAYRDVAKSINRFAIGKKVVDFGAGTGASAEFLHTLGFDVTGLDVSPKMLEQARCSLPHIPFYDVAEFSPHADFDVVFSSFVLLELPSTEEIIKYLNTARLFLKEGGIFVGITASEELYCSSREWMTFDTNFEENRSLEPGSITKVVLKDPGIEFHDYFWRRSDYLSCFEKAGFEMVEIISPLGSKEEFFPWKDELAYPVYTIFIARNPSVVTSV